MAAETKEQQSTTTQIDEVIDSFGCNRFSVQLVLIIGVLWMSEAVETNLIALIGPQLKCVWSLSNMEVSVTSSSVFTGAAIGSIYWGYFADKYGRKRSMVYGTFITVYFGLMSAASPNFTWFLVTRFFVGFGLGPVPSAACYISEFITRKYRGKAVVAIDFFYALGSVFVALVAMITIQQASWNVFLIVAAVPATIFLISSPWLPESIRFLQISGRYDEIMKLVNRISLASNQSVPLKQKTIECKEEKTDLSMLLTAKYLPRLIIITILFIASFWGYFGLAQFNTELLQAGGMCKLLANNAVNRTVITSQLKCHELTNSDYLQNIIVVLAEVPGLLLVVLFVDIIGRKWFVFFLALCSGIGFICLNICLSQTYTTVLMFAMRFLMIGFAQLPYLIASELFPTVVRASAIGIAVGVGKFSLIAVPYFVQYLLFISPIATTSVFSGLCILSAALVLFLPETKNKMLDTI